MNHYNEHKILVRNVKFTSGEFEYGQKFVFTLDPESGHNEGVRMGIIARIARETQHNADGGYATSPLLKGHKLTLTLPPWLPSGRGVPPTMINRRKEYLFNPGYYPQVGDLVNILIRIYPAPSDLHRLEWGYQGELLVVQSLNRLKP